MWETNKALLVLSNHVSTFNVMYAAVCVSGHSLGTEEADDLSKETVCSWRTHCYGTFTRLQEGEQFSGGVCTHLPCWWLVEGRDASIILAGISINCRVSKPGCDTAAEACTQWWPCRGGRWSLLNLCRKDRCCWGFFAMDLVLMHQFPSGWTPRNVALLMIFTSDELT